MSQPVLPSSRHKGVVFAVVLLFMCAQMWKPKDCVQEPKKVKAADLMTKRKKMKNGKQGGQSVKGNEWNDRPSQKHMTLKR